jgi:hypothetical protein
MNTSVPVLFAFWQEVAWIVPATGFVFACFAFIWGRRLVGQPEQKPLPSAQPAVPERPVDVFLHGSASDRRAAPRRKGNSVEVAVSTGPDQQPVHGWVLNRSVGGLCLMLDKPFEEGATLNVRPRNAPESTPWTPVEIRGCRAHGSDWEISCRFLKAPQYNVLLLFG